MSISELGAPALSLLVMLSMGQLFIQGDIQDVYLTGTLQDRPAQWLQILTLTDAGIIILELSDSPSGQALPTPVDMMADGPWACGRIVWWKVLSSGVFVWLFDGSLCHGLVTLPLAFPPALFCSGADFRADYKLLIRHKPTKPWHQPVRSHKHLGYQLLRASSFAISVSKCQFFSGWFGNSSRLQAQEALNCSLRFSSLGGGLFCCTVTLKFRTCKTYLESPDCHWSQGCCV